MRHIASAIIATSAILAAGTATGHATPLTVTPSLFTPVTVPGTTTPVSVSGIVAPSQSVVTGSGYSLSFSKVGAYQGIVQNTQASAHATPVAGVSGGHAEYLTGGYGSALTTNLAAAGNYLSTSLGNISLAFTADQTALGLLWGSIDAGNKLTLLEGGTVVGVVTGAEIQTLASGFVSNGYQGPGGSAYVEINSATPFNQVRFSSNTVSFEFGGVVGSTAPIGVPEPISLSLLTVGLAGIGMVRRKHPV